MTDNTNTPSPQPINDAADVNQFELTSSFDIAHTLRQLMNRREMVAVYFNQGAQFTLTTIIDVDVKKQTFMIDQSGSADTNRKLTQSERNIFVSTPDGIKHQFICGALRECKHDGGNAFQAALPRSLIKLQRREFFRIATPITNPLKCRIFDHPTGKLEYPLHDISLGGLCFSLATPRSDLQVLDQYHDCSLDLPLFGTLHFSLEIRNTRTERQRNGNSITFIGCQFHDLTGARQNLLQKYITQLQKEQLNLTA